MSRRHASLRTTASKTVLISCRFSLFLFSLLFNLMWVDEGFGFTDVVTYEHPGKTLRARIEVPAGEGPFPVVMAIHGGGFVLGDRTAFETSFFTHYRDLGFAVIATEYRLLSEGGAHPEAVMDCMHNLHWLIAHADEYNINTDFIVLQGSSVGSYMAMMLGLTAGEPDFQPDFGPYQGRTAQVRAVISSAAVYDWTVSSAISGEFYIGDFMDDPAASPVNRAGDSVCPNFLLLGGENDLEWSPPASAQAMQDSLVAKGIHSELHIRPGEGHPSFYGSTCGYCTWAFARVDPFLEGVVASSTSIGSAGVPERFRILSIAPNPFNPAVTIRFELPSAGLVSFKVIGVNGRVVRAQTYNAGSSGAREISGDGKNDIGQDVPSGIYFTCLEAGGQTRTQKMTLIR